MQTDLFAAPLLPGLAYREGLISADEEVALIEAIEGFGLMPFRFQGWLGKRVTVSFGWAYDFDKASFAETLPMPDSLLGVRAKAAAFAGLRSDDLVQVLVTRYDPGAGIGWHRDKAVFQHVVGVSLGAPTALRFRRRTDNGFERRALEVAPRSAYHLDGEARTVWEHSIAPMRETRWSLTFRSLSETGRRKGTP